MTRACFHKPLHRHIDISLIIRIEVGRVETRPVYADIKKGCHYDTVSSSILVETGKILKLVALNKRRPDGCRGAAVGSLCQRGLLEFSLDCLGRFFVAGLFEKSKHVALVSLYAGLVEGVHSEDVAGDTA